MYDLIRNPNTLDISNFLNGDVYVVGGRDFDKEDREGAPKLPSTQKDVKIELDWTSLLKTSKN